MVLKKTILLGEMLVDRKLITIEQLDIALAEHKKTSDFIGSTLIKLGFVTEEQLLPILSEQIGVEYVHIDKLRIDHKVIKDVPAKFACHYKLMPVRKKGKTLTLAVTDPLDIHTLDDLKLLLNCEVNVVLGGEKDILEGIRKYYGIGADTIEKIIAETAPKTKMEVESQETQDIEAMAEDASIIKFVNQLFLQAYKDRATDIHIEPYEDELKVRYRVDGILYDATIPPDIKHFQAAITSRIKVMAELNIAERRLPQDGRIKVKVSGEDLDLRISILPTPFGESVNIRLLSTNILYGLKNLGLLPHDLKIIEAMIKKPHGIVFVTGPTGSGKTTTLYAYLAKINNKDKKIITIEDPIEYQMKGITQLQVLPKIGLTFAQGLRSMLRHDPDIMMVGEVRDYETAEITIRVALTGHLVFSTLHTNDAPGAVTRLLDMGVEPFLVASSVECIVAQRLVRTVCPECKVPIKDKAGIGKEFGIKNLPDIEIYEGKGCQACKFTGYKGRTAIYEMLIMNEPIKELILTRTSSDQIRKKAIELGMRTLRQDGWEKVLMGITTPSEVLRVTQEEGIE
ncbi:MAG: Flp pilus assembly complex ATPase component TadA [Candidatus Omnitrophica bacterium]|nr:Flp pilus assembly complex ATPase component TadA [Candidatus Omnitrophota bacterium]